MTLCSLLNTAKRKALATVLSVALALGGGCAADRLEDDSDSSYLSRVLIRTDIHGGMEFIDWDISLPKAYSYTPPHPDDLNKLYGPNHPCKTREVNLTSGSIHSGVISVDIPPIPYWLFESIRVGWKGTFPDSGSNQIRDGLSSMEWYEYGAYAGTYTRVKMPKNSHSFAISWRQPIKLKEDFELFVQPGIAYDSWKMKVEQGWDRYYEEEPMVSHSFSSKSRNPFIRFGFMGYEVGSSSGGDSFSFGLSAFFEKERVDAETPYGHVKLRGDVWGIEAIFGF